MWMGKKTSGVGYTVGMYKHNVAGSIVFSVSPFFLGMRKRSRHLLYGTTTPAPTVRFSSPILDPTAAEPPVSASTEAVASGGEAVPVAPGADANASSSSSDGGVATSSTSSSGDNGDATTSSGGDDVSSPSVAVDGGDANNGAPPADIVSPPVSAGGGESNSGGHDTPAPVEVVAGVEPRSS